MEQEYLSQERKIIAYLKTGKTLTVKQATRRFGADRCSARIFRLIDRDGYDIRKDMIRISPRKRVAEYYLVRILIALISLSVFSCDPKPEPQIEAIVTTVKIVTIVIADYSDSICNQIRFIEASGFKVQVLSSDEANSIIEVERIPDCAWNTAAWHIKHSLTPGSFTRIKYELLNESIIIQHHWSLKTTYNYLSKWSHRVKQYNEYMESLKPNPELIEIVERCE